MEGDIKDITYQERAEKELSIAEREALKCENLLLHEKDIKGRPARTWFQSDAEKRQVREDSNPDPEKKKKKKKNKRGKEIEEEKKLTKKELKQLEKDKKEKFDALPRHKRRRITFEKEAAQDEILQKKSGENQHLIAKKAKKMERLRKFADVPTPPSKMKKDKLQKPSKGGKGEKGGKGKKGGNSFDSEMSKPSLLDRYKSKTRKSGSFKSKKKF